MPEPTSNGHTSPVLPVVDAATDAALGAPSTDPEPSAPALDLDRIEADLADVELALARLDSGEYWRDEVSGDEIPDELLAVRPTIRRAEA